MKRDILAVAILSMVLLLTGCAGEYSGGLAESRQTDPSETVDAEEENPAEQLRKNGAGMMVQLQAGDVLGSGVIYELHEDAAVILTAAHVVEKADSAVLVTFCDGYTAESVSFACSELADFAVVKVWLEDIPEENRTNYFSAKTDKESFDALRAGDGCIAMGCRTAAASEAYQGTILDNWIYMEDYGQHMIWVRSEGVAGMSGGGLFDLQGRFLGILSGESSDGELAAVPLSLILTELDNFHGMVENKE